MQPYQYDQWDRWTQRVRRATYKEMDQLRLQRAKAAQPIAPRAPISNQLRHWWLVTRTLLWGGIPVIEQRLMDWLAPPPQDGERALTTANAAPAQRHAA